MKANLGCGATIAPDWVNVDYALGAKLAKYPFFRQINSKLRIFQLDWNPQIFLHDLRRPFPWQDSSVDIIYSSHTLEHFSREEGVRLLRECWRVLKVNGTIRIVVPDLAYFVGQYLEDKFPADEFVERLGVLYHDKNGLLRRILAPFCEFPHRCMYDGKTLVKTMQNVGFTVRVEKPFQSKIEDIARIESAARTAHSLIVEGEKPLV